MPMNIFIALPVTLPMVLLLSVPAARAQDEPPAIFAKLDYETALARSKAEGRTLILDAMTSWCAPCKQMDRTTWIDPRLVAWVAERGLAIQLDMDELVDVRKALGVTAYPTIVLFQDGSEYDRVVGFRTADAMLAWLGAALEGKRAEDLMLEELADLRASADPARAWGERSRLVQDLLFTGLRDEALVELLWLYDLRASQPAEIRGRFWSRHFHDLQGLADESADAREAFTDLHQDLTARVAQGATDEGLVRDWIRLGFVVGEGTATFDWADERASTSEGVASLRRFEALLFEPLVAAGRWRTAGLLLEDPLGHVRFLRDTLGAYDQPLEIGSGGAMPLIPMGGPKPKVIPAIPISGGKPAAAWPGAARRGKVLPMIPMLGGASVQDDAPDAAAAQAAEIRRRLTEQFRREAATCYAALLAAGREGEAAEVAGVLIGELDDARARTALVAAAMRAGVEGRAREAHQLWLDEAAR